MRGTISDLSDATRRDRFLANDPEIAAWSIWTDRGRPAPAGRSPKFAAGTGHSGFGLQSGRDGSILQAAGGAGVGGFSLALPRITRILAVVRAVLPSLSVA